MSLFSGKTVIVTGAGLGIGRATAVGFAADGANVLGIGRTRADLVETRRLCPAGSMDFVVGDVSRPENIAQLLAKAKQLHGGADILVNNAALYPKTGFLESTDEEWTRVIQTNVVGMALCCRAFLPGMLERGFGRIINIGTLAWLGPIPNSSAYSASKGAVRPLTRAIACEIDRFRHPDVLVNELLPGVARTRMSDHGEDPAAIYAHVRFVASLPRNGPTGRTFMQSALYVEDYRLRSRLRRLLSRLTGGLVSAE